MLSQNTCCFGRLCRSVRARTDGASTFYPPLFRARPRNRIGLGAPTTSPQSDAVRHLRLHDGVQLRDVHLLGCALAPPTTEGQLYKELRPNPHRTDVAHKLCETHAVHCARALACRDPGMRARREAHKQEPTRAACPEGTNAIGQRTTTSNDNETWGAGPCATCARAGRRGLQTRPSNGYPTGSKVKRRHSCVRLFTPGATSVTNLAANRSVWGRGASARERLCRPTRRPHATHIPPVRRRGSERFLAKPSACAETRV